MSAHAFEKGGYRPGGSGLSGRTHDVEHSAGSGVPVRQRGRILVDPRRAGVAIYSRNTNHHVCRHSDTCATTAPDTAPDALIASPGSGCHGGLLAAKMRMVRIYTLKIQIWQFLRKINEMNRV
jgi:hypothetical protein